MKEKDNFIYLETRIANYEEKGDYTYFPMDVVMGLCLLYEDLDRNNDYKDFSKIYKIFSDQGFYDFDNKENVKNMVNIIIEEKLVLKTNFFINILPHKFQKKLTHDWFFKKMQNKFSHPDLLHSYLYEMDELMLLQYVDLGKIIDKYGKKINLDSVELIFEQNAFNFFKIKDDGTFPYEKLNKTNQEFLKEENPEGYALYEKSKIAKSLENNVSSDMNCKKRL